MLKAVIYIRKSTDRDDKQALSLESQLAYCRGIAKVEKLDIIEVIEESKSAKAPGREGFTNMMDRAAKQEFDVIICWKMNRLARNPLDAGTITWCLQKANIKKIITSDGTFTPDTNELLLSVQFGLSSQFIKDLRKDVIRGMQTAVEKGIVVQRQPPGYSRDKNINKIYPDKNARLIKEAFRMRADGKTFSDIRTYFAKNDFKTSLSVVERIIKNRFYYGFMLWNGQFFRGDYTAIIDKEAYDKANGVYRGQYEICKDRFSLKGYVTDTNGKPLKASLSKGKFIYYHRDKMWVNEEIILKKFEDTIIPFMTLNGETRQEFTNAMLDEQKSLYMENIQSIDTIEARKKGLQTRRDNLFDMRVSGEIDGDLYKEKNTELHDKIMQCDIDIRKISEMDEDIREKCLLFVGLVENLSSTWKSLNSYQKGRLVKAFSVGLKIDQQKEVYIDLCDPFDAVYNANILAWCPEQEKCRTRLYRSIARTPLSTFQTMRGSFDLLLVGETLKR